MEWGITMNAQEEITAAPQEVATGTGPTEDEQLKGPVGWYILQAINGLDTKIDSGIVSLNARIDGLDTKIDSGIASLNTRIDGVSVSLNTRIDGLGKKIDDDIREVRQDMKSLTRLAIGTIITTAVAAVGIIATVVIGVIYLANHIR